MPRVPGSSRKRVTLPDSSDESAAEVDDAGRDEDDEDDLPLLRSSTRQEAPRIRNEDDQNVSMPSSAKNLRSSQSVSTRLQKAVIISDDDEDEDEDDDIVAPSSTLKRRRRAPSKSSSKSESDDDNDDIAPPSTLRRRRPVMVELEDSDSDQLRSPTKKRKVDKPAPPSQNTRRRLQPSSPVRRSAHKGHRSEKEKKMELLRRRRNGEKIDKLTSSESSSEDDRRGIYDTDPEDEFEVLKEFEDDEDSDEPNDEQEEEPTPRSARKAKKKALKQRGTRSEEAAVADEGGDGEDDNLDDFVVEDDEGPLGAPAHLDIPLEFTSQAHKPLKEQFPYAVEWLVHNRVDPAFERRDPVYNNAWRKLDDEFRGLANSKFASSVWRPEFYRALKGRPRMETYDMAAGVGSIDGFDNCAACGRSNHPATRKIVFQGKPYYKDTLQEVESDSDSDDEDDDKASVDTQGMPLEPESRDWFVGAVCCSNATTAHGLIHWKHALKEWVEERLDDEGWNTPARIQEREALRPKKRRALADSIVDAWRRQGVVDALYADFKATLEEARSKATTGSGRSRGGWR